MSVPGHYTIDDLATRILDALAAAGKDLEALTVDDLAPVDAFHIRGRAATDELIALAGLRPEETLLDVGSGLGGTCRHVASTTGASVVGIDVTEAYVRHAEMLSAMVGLSGRTTFVHGSALDLPFEDDRFDVVWTEHVQMNVDDQRRFYAEIARVLRPGGRFAFHDIFAGAAYGDGSTFRYPVPWASDASISHLFPGADLEALLAELGFTAQAWHDRTDVSATFFRTVLERVRADGWTPLGIHLLMGDDAGTKIANLLDNLDAGRVQVLKAVMSTAPSRPG